MTSEIVSDVVAKLADKAAGYLTEAIVDEESNISNCNEEIKSLLRTGAQQIQDQRYEDAITSFERAAKLDPNNISPRLRLIKVYKAMDHDLVALVVGGGALVLATEPKTRAQIFNFMGEIGVDIYKMSKHTPHIMQALGFYDQAVDANPDDIVPQWNRVAAYCIHEQNEKDTAAKKKVRKRAEQKMNSVIGMGRLHVGNSATYWPAIISDAETGDWYPRRKFWKEKLDEVRDIGKNISVALSEDSQDRTQENVVMFSSESRKKTIKAGLLAASIVLAILGWSAFPTADSEATPVSPTEITETVGSAHTFTIYTDEKNQEIQQVGIEHDWQDLAAIQHSWDDLA